MRETERALRTWPASFHLNAKQEVAWEMFARPVRHTMLVGGARASKTFLIVLRIVQRALAAPGSRHLIAKLHHNSAIKAIWLDTLPKVMRLCYPGIEYGKSERDTYIKLPGGSEVWVSGLDTKERVEKILGLEFATIFFNECSHIAYSTVALVRTRLAQHVPLGEQPPGADGAKAMLPIRVFYDLNPTGTGHWTHKLFVEKLDPETFRAIAQPDQYQHLFMTPADNRENLPPEFETELAALPERQRKRFLEGLYQTEIEGALWTLDAIDRQRIVLDRPYDPQQNYGVLIPPMKRMVIAVDPSGTKGEDEDKRSNEVGIVAAGLGVNGDGYIFADLTCNLPPDKWADRVAVAYDNYLADRVIAEINFGGEMVRHTIRTAAPRINVRVITASRGKAVRAEPIAALYEPLPGQQFGRIWHVGPSEAFRRLEDQMLNMSTAGYTGSKSPDRLDAAVWGLTDLMIRPPGPPQNGQQPRSLPIFGR